MIRVYRATPGMNALCMREGQGCSIVVPRQNKGRLRPHATFLIENAWKNPRDLEGTSNRCVTISNSIFNFDNEGVVEFKDVTKFTKNYLFIRSLSLL